MTQWIIIGSLVTALCTAVGCGDSKEAEPGETSGAEAVEEGAEDAADAVGDTAEDAADSVDEAAEDATE